VGDNGPVSNTGPAERPAATATPDEVSIRRAPKFGVFIVGGGLVGFVVTIIVVALTWNIDRSNSTAVTGTTATEGSFWSVVGYFSLWGISIGLVVGAIVAVVLDRVLSRRAARLTAERVDVVPPVETVDGDIDES
jgi:hypothetical protein